MNENTEIIIKPKPKWALLDFSELWRYRELFWIFAWRDIKVRYKQTILGAGWALLQPLLSMFIFTIFFGDFAKIPSGELPYPLFVLIDSRGDLYSYPAEFPGKALEPSIEKMLNP